MSSNPNNVRNSFRSTSLRRVGSLARPGMDSVPADDFGMIDNAEFGGGSGRMAAVAVEREQTRRRLSRELEEGEEEEEEEEEEAAAPIRMSLMDLLEETDRQAGLSGPTYRLDEEEEDEEEEDEEEGAEGVAEESGGKGEGTCCVCMVKHKGGGLTPCGHTFCRLCSKELWVQRGNCPLCNNFILEILEIF